MKLHFTKKIKWSQRPVGYSNFFFKKNRFIGLLYIIVLGWHFFPDSRLFFFWCNKIISARANFTDDDMIYRNPWFYEIAFFMSVMSDTDPPGDWSTVGKSAGIQKHSIHTLNNWLCSNQPSPPLLFSTLARLLTQADCTHRGTSCPWSPRSLHRCVHVRGRLQTSTWCTHLGL
jgi:hypothetical protein